MINEQQAQLDALDNEMAVAKEAVAKLELLQELENNKAFTELVSEGYFKDEAVRLVWSLSQLELQDPKLQEDLNKQIQAIGQFRQHLSRIHAHGMRAKDFLNNSGNIRQEILEDSLED